MNKGIIIGIIVAGIIIGFLAVFSFDPFTLIDNSDNEKTPIFENDEKNSSNDSKPQGRDLSIEFDEKMGFSSP